MNVNIRVSVCRRDLIVVDLRQPVIRGDRSRVAQDKTADRVCYGRVLLDSPIKRAEVFVNYLGIIEVGRFHIAELFTVTAVKDISLRHVSVSRLAEHRLNAVLNVFDGDEIIFYFRFKIRRDLKREKIDHSGNIISPLRLKSLLDRGAYFFNFKINYFSISFNYPIHH